MRASLTTETQRHGKRKGRKATQSPQRRVTGGAANRHRFDTDGRATARRTSAGYAGRHHARDDRRKHEPVEILLACVSGDRRERCRREAAACGARLCVLCVLCVPPRRSAFVSVSLCLGGDPSAVIVRAPMPQRERLHGSLSTVEYFTFGFGTMSGVGWP